jgi:hypothetical protein
MLVASLVILSAPGFAHAGICQKIDKAANLVAAAASAGTSGQALLATAPVAAVPHSSGALILTGTGGYLAHTLGSVAGVWAVATAPVTIAITAGIAAVSAGVLVTCKFQSDDAGAEGTADARTPYSKRNGSRDEEVNS